MLDRIQLENNIHLDEVSTLAREWKAFLSSTLLVDRHCAVSHSRVLVLFTYVNSSALHSSIYCLDWLIRERGLDHIEPLVLGDLFTKKIRLS